LQPEETRLSGPATLPAQEQCERQVHRILRSATFRNASMLQQLLQFLATKAFDHGSDSLKEYTIGVEALSRPQDFDPKTDTIVRVQIHRLRQKLKEYYDSDGSLDPILIDIPKGHYLPSFEAVAVPEPVPALHPAPPPAPLLDAHVSVATSFLGANHAEPGHAGPNHAGPGHAEPGHAEKVQLPAGPETHPSRAPRFGRILLVSAAAMAVFAGGFWIGVRHTRAEKDPSALTAENLAVRPSDPVRIFWANLIGNDPAPVLAYPDAVFLLDNSNDLFRFRRGASDDRGALVDPHVALQFASNPDLVSRAGQLYYENAYLGSGDMRGLTILANLFGLMGLRPIIKPSREITPDDLKQHNVIMLGSSFQNFAVAQLSNTGDFSFRNPDTRLEEWRGMIVNAHPRPNEAAIYHTERDPVTQVLKTDYSLISIQPGVVPGRYIATLGGLDTTGTEGAVLYATSRPGVEELSRTLASLGEPTPKDAPALFQALISVRLEKGYEVLGSSLVSVHPVSAPHAGAAGGSPSSAQ
jgi:hypothetical protein